MSPSGTSCPPRATSPAARVSPAAPGNAHMCERTSILGVDRDGAFARYVAVPESVIWKTDRTKLPPEIATLQEPFGNAVFATSEQDLSGRTVAVLGCGPVGLFTIAIARASGAARILASDLHPFRLGLARHDGGGRGRRRVRGRRTWPGWYARPDGRSRRGRRVRDVRVAVSRSSDAIKIARNGGRMMLFGIPSRRVEVDVAAAIFKNLTVQARRRAGGSSRRGTARAGCSRAALSTCGR